MDLDILPTEPGVKLADGKDDKSISNNNDQETEILKIKKDDKYCPLVYREPEERIPKLDSDDHLSSDQDDEGNIKSSKSHRLLPLRYAGHSSRDSSPPSDAANTNNHTRSHDDRRAISEKHQHRPQVRHSSVIVKRRRRDIDDGEDDTIPAGEEDPNSRKRKEELMQSQRNNKQVFDRNKRMFGMLMGTLKKFKTEETSREEVTLKRSIIDEKIVESTRVADEDSGPTTRELPRIMQDADDEADLVRSEIIDKAEFKLDILGRHKNWESSHKHLASFIQTETRPKIFWLPKEHNESTEKLLKGTRDYYNLFMAERAAKCKKELEDLEKTPLRDLISVAPAGWRSSTSRDSTRSPDSYRHRHYRRTPPRREYRSPASETSSESYRRH